MSGNKTLSELMFWRRDSKLGEYLSADILRLEGFRNIDPIHPNGGPDNKHDMKCVRNTTAFIAAAYFPNDSGKISFADVKAKFEDDCKGIKVHSAGGFAFITNCALSLGERKNLEKIAKKSCGECEIYHAERLRAILDSQKGVGTRLRVLDIEISKADLLAFIDIWQAEHLANLRMLPEIRDDVKDVKAMIAQVEKNVLAKVESAIKQGSLSKGTVAGTKGGKK